MKNIRMYYGLSSLLSLVLGMCIYFLFRDLNNLFFIKWIPILTFMENVFVKLTPSIFSYILMYNFPDMLWFVSGILLLRFIWFNREKEQKKYIINFYIIGILFEISQISRVFPGTFDRLDLLFMGIGAFIEGLLYKKLINRRLKWKTEKKHCCILQQ